MAQIGDRIRIKEGSGSNPYYADGATGTLVEFDGDVWWAKFDVVYGDGVWCAGKVMDFDVITKENEMELNQTNNWQAREQARMDDGTYTPLKIAGDDPARFLHWSTDEPNKVAYTKDAEKGALDIQTRTTLPEYCEKFGLQMNQETPVPVEPARYESPYESEYCTLRAAVSQYFDALDDMKAAKARIRDLI